jgi:hypothetical protein
MSKTTDKVDNIRYLVNTPIDELIADGSLVFIGESEQERMVSVVQFTRVRNLMQKYAQTLTADDTDALLTSMKTYLVKK